MTTYNLKDFLAYPVRYETSDDGIVTAYFRDFDGTTQAYDAGSIDRVALDWLVLSGTVLPKRHELIPKASAPQAGEKVLEISPTIALKFILRNAMTSRNLRPSDLGRILGMSSQAINALLDVYREGTRFDSLFKALQACGCEVSITSV
ncbi:MAG: hypothetical protein PUG38_02980 [Sutterellaceae bacterium]|nr:hypothetical protein [Sutterellaceae bacterium]MDY2868470.1 hypothetical protein [Mesosutterella sp.]